MRSKWWGIFLGSLVILLIVYIGFGTDLLSQSEEIGTIYLPRTANEKDAQRNGVILSKEYSFKFNRTNLLPRTSNADRILSVINKVYDNILRVNGEPLTVVNGDAAARSEEAYGNKACGVKEIIRSRRYLVGWNSPSSTVDIKASLLSSKSNDFVLSKFKANDSFADDMMHKLEEGIYEQSVLLLINNYLSCGLTNKISQTFTSAHQNFQEKQGYIIYQLISDLIVVGKLRDSFQII